MRFRLRKRSAETRASLANPDAYLLDAFGATASYTGERVSVDTAMTLAAVRSAVTMIAQSAGQLPLKVYRVVGDDDRVEARDHRSWRMLHDKPNEYCIARTFWTASAAQLLLYENAFIYKQRDPLGQVESLYHLDPCQVRVEIDGGSKRYVVEGPPRAVYTDDDVCHVVGYSVDGYYGNSRISQAKQTLGTALARARFEGEFYANGAMVPGVIQYPGALGEQGLKNLSETFAARHSGKGKRHKVPVLEEGATWATTGQTLEGMQFAQLAEQTRTDIAVLFHIPPAYLGGSTGDSLTYATTESNSIQYAQMAVLPVADAIAKALSQDPGILPWNVMYAEFVLEGLLRADMKTRMEYWAGMKNVLNLDPKYIAARENIPLSALEKPKPVPAPLQDFQQQPDQQPTNGQAPQIARVQ